jgi:hypothetical protein
LDAGAAGACEGRVGVQLLLLLLLLLLLDTEPVKEEYDLIS